jgi:hypothetical protein
LNFIEKPSVAVSRQLFGLLYRQGLSGRIIKGNGVVVNVYRDTVLKEAALVAT